MSLKHLVMVIALSATLLTGCGGGGGGGGNPAAPSASALLASEYPKISTSYTAMQTALVNQADTTDNTVARIADFMKSISDPFYDKFNVSNRADLEATTKSRLERYKVKSYTMTPVRHEKVDEKTVKVSTFMMIQVELKPGATGNAGTLPYYLGENPNTSEVETEIFFIWKLDSDGEWRVQSGLPYRADELF